MCKEAPNHRNTTITQSVEWLEIKGFLKMNSSQLCRLGLGVAEIDQQPELLGVAAVGMIAAQIYETAVIFF